jgi:hypothetical protein
LSVDKTKVNITKSFCKREATLIWIYLLASNAQDGTKQQEVHETVEY